MRIIHEEDMDQEVVRHIVSWRWRPGARNFSGLRSFRVGVQGKEILEPWPNACADHLRNQHLLFKRAAAYRLNDQRVSSEFLNASFPFCF